MKVMLIIVNLLMDVGVEIMLDLFLIIQKKNIQNLMIIFALMMQFPSVLWALALGNTDSILLIAMASFSLGIAMDLFYVFWVTTIQQHVAKDSLSKVLAYDAWGSMAMAPLIMGIAGPITEYFGTKVTLNAISIICFIALLMPFLVKEVREIKAN